MAEQDQVTLEWFGATTFRLRANGLTMFLDTWLDRPKVMPVYLAIDQVKEADYIFISHAHFDHLPGADRLAKQTGAIVIANGEAITCLREAGVPEDQLLPVAGGERIPLFTKAVRDQAKAGTISRAPGPPLAPPLPDVSHAAMSVHCWPSLHALLPGRSHADIPDEMDTAQVYEGASPYACTLDITRGMRYGLLRLNEFVPEDHLDAGERSFIEYISDRQQNILSNFDGGQIMYNFLLGDRTIMYNAHLGAYRGILEHIEPKPDVLIQAIAGRANIDGRPYDGSAAQASTMICKLLGEPKQVIWCLHDEGVIKPWRIKTDAATKMVESETGSRIVNLEPKELYTVFGT
ncbi:Metallo-hydrolase/oxidoreductase [Myriangium duriaei CBS 260.36]|uniref:Metallo-hydrolase/oxidoreductase n=1 Tax=Myriangium duriaei CBS 260.36 TaxID=1168546 RepID=A0A9P4J0B4_9PEZI|nr:Metallo-hydrolase/oxidoreductase [Myriangium duriaei CBS 260.36]